MSRNGVSELMRNAGEEALPEIGKIIELGRGIRAQENLPFMRMPSQR